MDNVEEKVKSLVSYCLNISEEKVTDDALFIDDLGADSIAVVDIIMAIEDEFKIMVEEEDITKITTVKDLVKYIEDRI